MKATFGAGCFWHVEEIFRKTKGVKSTQVGYSGGMKQNPTYEDVCTDTTGHAESVQVDYDPEEIPYEDLLKIFWNNHNPTTPNRQGPDIGTQYRSVIFFHTPEQEKDALEMKTKLDSVAREKFNAEITTEIKSNQSYFFAEEYHQQYLDKNPNGYCGIGGTGCEFQA
jgi:peptide-methionine (S)-S-oxide reductase